MDIRLVGRIGLKTATDDSSHRWRRYGHRLAHLNPRALTVSKRVARLCRKGNGSHGSRLKSCRGISSVRVGGLEFSLLYGHFSLALGRAAVAFVELVEALLDRGNGGADLVDGVLGERLTVVGGGPCRSMIISVHMLRRQGVTFLQQLLHFRASELEGAPGLKQIRDRGQVGFRHDRINVVGKGHAQGQGDCEYRYSTEDLHASADGEKHAVRVICAHHVKCCDTHEPRP